MSASEFEFPPAALFSTIALCPWREHSPRVDGHLGDWSPEQRMPPLGELAGVEQYADLFLAWNERGLYLALEVPKQERIVTNRESPASGDAVELFLYRRRQHLDEAGDVGAGIQLARFELLVQGGAFGHHGGGDEDHRQNRYQQADDQRQQGGQVASAASAPQQALLPVPPGEADGKPQVIQQPIRRALQRSQPISMSAVRAATGVHEESYVLELALGAEALHGYEPRPGLRIGMAVVVHDIQRGRQLWGAAPDVPYERDPSTWGIVEHLAPQ